MCGIAGGVWSDPAAALSADVAQQMVTALAHRGPDDAGLYRSECLLQPGYDAVPGVALGARRLAIIDRKGGHQPIANEDRTVWLVCNGEIYNFHELQQRLQGSGHQLQSQCDIETLVHLYEDEGPQFLSHIRGMFALALWDSRKRLLLLARDRLGKKPLVYSLQRDRILFASELKSLWQVPGVSRSIDPQALDEYLAFQYIPAPRTISVACRKLPPGHYAIYRQSQLEITRYWSPPAAQEISLGVPAASEQLRAQLTGAVRRRLVSEVPLGAFLSGGVDSSLVVGLMSELGAAPVETFAVGFAEREYDERPFAKLVANHFKTQHHEFELGPEKIEHWPALAQQYDEPFGDSSALPTWYLAQQTRKHVTVALTGDGGDELFAGYRHHFAAQLGGWFDRSPSFLRRWLASPLWQRFPAPQRQTSWLRRWLRLSEGLGRSPAARHLQWIAIFGEARRASLYTDEFIAALPNADPTEHLERAWQVAAGRDPVTQCTVADLLTYLPGDLLVKVDLASMAHGLECRCPWLDEQLVEFAVALPAQYKLRWGRGKWLVRKTFEKLLPKAIWQRRKQGFGVPVGQWFRGPWKERVQSLLLDPQALRRGYFRPAAIEQLVTEHLTGQFDHGARLWSLCMFELWQQTWGDR